MCILEMMEVTCKGNVYGTNKNADLVKENLDGQ